MSSLYLASTSPRRKELLQQIGVSFDVLSVDVDETPLLQESPADYVQRLALQKAWAGLASLEAGEDNLVLGGDTAVVCDGQIFGKPVNREDALTMLERLSGRMHQVYSAVSLVNNERHEVRLTVTQVAFMDLSVRQRERYWDTGEPRGKAGAYAIQGFGAVFVKSIEGSYSGVVGMPLVETAELLNCFNVPFWEQSQ